MAHRYRSDAELKLVYARVLKVLETDPHLTQNQIRERFGIGSQKLADLRKEAKEIANKKAQPT